MSDRIKQDISMGENFRRLRRNAELSQEDSAAKMQLMGIPISREILSQMERGQYSVRVSVLLAMKKIYQVNSFDDFFAGLSLEDE